MCGNSADEIHHMKYQQDADENGFIGHTHKNHVSNLMSICSTCHDQIHKEDKRYKRVKTTKGNKIVAV